MGTTVGKTREGRGCGRLRRTVGLRPASPEPVNPARSSRRQHLTPLDCFIERLNDAPGWRRGAWVGGRLGWDVAVGAALLFESGFRRRGAGLLASACSVVGSDSRRLLRPARGLRAEGSAFSPMTPMCSAIFHGGTDHGLRVLPVQRGLAPADPAISIRSTMRSPPVDTIATVMAMRTARPMANLMASCLDW